MRENGIIKINQRLLAMIISVLGVTILVACTSETMPEVGKAIEGTYSVYYYDQELGSLSLSGNSYSFVLKDGATIPTRLIDPPVFMRYPQGGFEITYNEPITSGTSLGSLGDGIVIEIGLGFRPASPTSQTEVLVIWNRLEEKVFCLSDLGAYQQWGACKPWNQ